MAEELQVGFVFHFLHRPLHCLELAETMMGVGVVVEAVAQFVILGAAVQPGSLLVVTVGGQHSVVVAWSRQTVVVAWWGQTVVVAAWRRHTVVVVLAVLVVVEHVVRTCFASMPEEIVDRRLSNKSRRN